MTQNYSAQCPLDSGYCCKIRNHLAKDSDVKWQQMRERALFRQFSATRQPETDPAPDPLPEDVSIDEDE